MKTILEGNMENILDLPVSNTVISNSSVQSIVPTYVTHDVTIVPAVEEVKDDTNKRDDFDFARENIINIIDKGKDALNDLLDIAATNQEARTYEVASDLIEKLINANKDLLELQKRFKDLNEETNTGPNNIKNAIFVGSTTDLQKLLSRRRGEDNDVK